MRYTLSKEFIGYGHYRLTVKDESGKEISAITGDTDLVDRLSSELEDEKRKAIDEAIERICIGKWGIRYKFPIFYANVVQ